MARNKNVYPTTAKAKQNGNGTANLGFEQKLWLAADKLRGNKPCNGKRGQEGRGDPEMAD